MTMTVEPHRIENQSLEGQVVEFSKRTGCNGAYRTSFVDCELVLDQKGLPALRGGGRFEFGFVRLARCTIRGVGPVHDLRLMARVVLRECRFEGGPFTEAQLGLGYSDPRPPLDGWDDSSIEHCDLTAAAWHDALIFQTDGSMLQLPGWPHIAVIGVEAGAALLSVGKTRPGISDLYEAVEAMDWQDEGLARAMKMLTYSVMPPPHPLSGNLSHADEYVRYGAGSRELLLDALKRLSHPAIHY